MTEELSEQPLDPDLQSLMNELGKVEGEIPKPDISKLEDIKVDVKQEEKIDVKPEDKLVELKSEIIKDAEINEMSEFELKKARIQERLIGLIDTHCDSATRIIEDVESDRTKCDDVYSILFAKLQNNDYRASDAAAITTVLQVKADITKTRANMMDSVAKLLGSLKNNNTINTGDSNSDGLSQEEVNRLLDRPSGTK
jgi:hypothetical protein